MSESSIARRPLLLASTAFTFGVLAGASSSPWVDLAVVVVTALITLFAARARRVLAVLLLPIPFFVAGTVAAALRAPPAETISNTPDVFDRDGVILEGFVVEAPELGRDAQTLILDAVATATAPGAALAFAEGRVRVFVPGIVRCGGPGDRVRIWARLMRPEPALLPLQYSAEARAIRRNVALHAGAIDRRACLVLTPKEKSGLRLSLEALRDSVHRAIDRALNEDEAAVVRAFATGDRRAISKELDRSLRAAGLSHLMAISGLNLAILAGLFTLVLAWILRRSERITLGLGARRAAAMIALPFVVIYTLFTGAAPSAVRSAVMVMALLGAAILRRPADAWNALALSLLLMLAWDPTSIGDVSLQLSFAAVTALLRVYPFLRKKLAPRLMQRPPWVRWPIEVGLASAAATIGTAPLVARQFHELSPIGLLANIPAAPLASLILVPLSLIGGLLGTIADPAALPFLWLAGFAAKILIAIAHAAAMIPGAIVHPPTPSLFECTLFYLAILGLTSQSGRRFPRRLGLAALILTFASFAGAQAARLLNTDLRVAVLPVGQGDAIVAELPHGKVIVIDAGPANVWGDAAERVIVPYLRTRRIGRIDLFVLTHPHADHSGGLNTLADQFEIGELWWNGDRREVDPSLLAAIDSDAVVVTASTAPRTIEGVTLEVLGPINKADRVNDGSVVLRLHYQDKTVLLAGDAEKAEENSLIERWGEALKADVLKLGHHGSKTSSSEEFLKQVEPQHAIASLGRDNRFGFPHQEVVTRLEQRQIKLWRTDQRGLIWIDTDGQTLEVHAFRDSPAAK